MFKWLAVGAAGTAVSYFAVHFALQPSAPPVAAPEPPAAVAAPAAPPVVLSQVVDVTDLDPLLDPPAPRSVGVPFDAAEATVPVNAVPPGVAPLPIPIAD